MNQKQECNYQILILLLLLVGCNGRELPEYPNPHWDGLFGRNVKMMVSTNSADSTWTDSVFFEFEKRIVRMKTKRSLDISEFDEKMYVIRSLQKSDVFYNLKFLHEFDEEGNILEIVQVINSENWEYTDQELDTVLTTITLEVRDNRVVGEKSETLNLTFHYDSIGRLKEQVFSPPSAPRVISYHYDSRGYLVRVDTKNKDITESSSFYSDGLLDSTRFNNYTIYCRYLFWR